MFFAVLDILTNHVRNLVRRKNKAMPSTPRNSMNNIAEMNEAEANEDLARDYMAAYQARVYKRSEPIDIVYPKPTW
ncbi:unnamed protein product [Heligmosomoides polygyrus]|uniref:DUF4834 domain-containing protein n=1 Tax=Heligmosomoides polygyrus TaxID=6339 RepID=A0A183FLC9_HELPZ|nr:unnamed protein product [Heligmosomoides polygyrus]